MAYNFQLEYTLSPQSPLIHFQYDTDGATLRATEVKPKLDRFLLRRAKAEGIDFKKWVNKKHETALDYKLEIKPADNKRSNLIGLGRNTPYEIYYGNMSRDENARETFAIRKGAILTITCFNSELRKFIDDNIDDFFIVTNFGRMSSKGFGSFLVTKKWTTICNNGEIKKEEEKRSKYSDTHQIADILKTEYGAKVCCCFVGGDNDTAFKRIKVIYSLMKSGLNFNGYQRSILFLYAHEKLKLDNEKAHMKEKKIAPAVSRTNRNYHKPQHGEERARYVRALLGVGDHINFKNDPNNKKSTFTEISITDERGENDPNAVARFPSPILFKVIGSTVYYIARPIDPKIHESTFAFSNKSSENIHNECIRDSVTLSVPLASEIIPTNPEREDIRLLDDFLLYSMKIMNSKSKDDRQNRIVLDIFDITNGVRIEEV